jgi:hypothetical protein
MLKEAEADEGTAEIEECQMQVSQAFIADGQPPEAVEPGEGALHDPPEPSELVAGFNATSSDATADAATAQIVPTAWIVVALIGMQLIGSHTRAPAWPLDRLDGLEQVFEDNRVVDVGRREPDREWDALAVDQEVPFRARFAAVGRVRADRLVRTAPLFAGMLEASRLARDQSIVSAAPSRSRTAR